MNRQADFRTGAKALFVGCDLQWRETTEAVTIAPTRKSMLPLPDGYVPVRFADGCVLLAPTSRLRAS